MFRILFVLLIALALLVGCSPKQATAPNPPSISAIHIGSSISDVIASGGILVRINPDGTRLYRMPNGAPNVVVGPISVIQILDYPCSFVGPIPQGHGRDCGT